MQPNDKQELKAEQKEDADDMKDKQKLDRSKRFARMNYGFLFFLGLGFVAICGYTHCWQKAAVASLWALAAFVTGALVGLLFGVQRVRQPRPDQSDSKKPSQTEINNNLVEVSDWLTKIIVGVGLVELSSWPEKLHRAAQPLANCLGGDCGLAAAVGILVFFSVIGFLIGFVDYRTFLAILIRESDDQVSSRDVEEIKESIARANDVIVETKDVLVERQTAAAQQLVQLQKEIAEHMVQKHKELMDSTFKDISYREIAENALRLLRGGNSTSPDIKHSVEEALQQLKNARAKSPTNRLLAILIGRLLNALQRTKEARSILKETLAERREANISINKDDAALLFNAACYENLEAEDPNLTPIEAENKRKQAWEDLQQACKLDPDNKNEAIKDEDLRTLFKTGEREAASL